MTMTQLAPKRKDKNSVRVVGKVKDVVLDRRRVEMMPAVVATEENKNSKIF